MTIEEFKADLARCQRSLMWRMVCAIAALFVALGIAGVFRYFSPDLADIVAPIIMFAIGVPCMLWGFYHADRAYREYPALVCPHCEGNLFRSKSVVIATGNCPNCGRCILNDDAIGA